ncbi:hypothetical protein [Rouxiella sp. WC2420]|uniref:Uncharacterized protein n=1 Tax=Rouxiella sp. WC2420 TaxID=3234145 RepID=A0AB39VLU0_9GAMM
MSLPLPLLARVLAIPLSVVEKMKFFELPESTRNHAEELLKELMLISQPIDNEPAVKLAQIVKSALIELYKN